MLDSAQSQYNYYMNISLTAMASDEIENHWRLLAWAVDSLLNLKPGDYPPISYEQTYSAVYKCVCQGYAEELYKRLLEEMERQLKVFNDRLQAVPDDQLIEAFNTVWVHFSGGLGGIVPIFNYMARFYVEAKLNLNLRTEIMKIFDNVVLQPIIGRLFSQLRYAQSAPFAVHPATMESVVRALYKLRPNSVNELMDLYRRFIPELIQQVHVEELADLQNEARRMMADFNNRNNDFDVDRNRSFDLQRLPSIVCASGGACGDSRINDPSSIDASMDFQMLDDDITESIPDPVIGSGRRIKRPRSRMDSGDEADEGPSGIGEFFQNTLPDEPSPSPGSVDNNRTSSHNLSASGFRSRKHFHGDNNTND